MTSCKAAGADLKHQRRPIHDDGLCFSCWHARRRHRRASGRLGTVRRLYGWAGDELEALSVFLRRRCPICRRRVGVVKQGSVDHDHRLERAGVPKRWQVRGILCSTCNRWLGHIGDDPAAAIRAALYLIDPPAPHVLRELDRRRHGGQDGHVSSTR